MISKNKAQIAIVGIGYVGGAVKHWFKKIPSFFCVEERGRSCLVEFIYETGAFSKKNTGFI